MTDLREYTSDEIRSRFLRYLWAMLDYWLQQDRSKADTLEGFAHSILSTLDGCSIGLPGFIVAPLGCDEDKEFYFEQGENWFPCNANIVDSVKGDIGGCLHEQWYREKPTTRPGVASSPSAEGCEHAGLVQDLDLTVSHLP
jgi:hypothetical protein